MKIDGMTAKEYYASLEVERQPFLDRARQVSELTIPTLLPPEGYHGQKLDTPWQGLGARGTQSLASKLLLALFPPNQSYVRMQIPAELNTQMGQGNIRSDVEAHLAKAEKMVISEMEALSLRPHLHEVKKHLLVAGNVCLKVPADDDRTKVHHLDHYVVKRDPSGAVLGGVIKEQISLELLPEEIKAKVIATPGGSTDNNMAEVYTAIILKDNKYHVFQEVEGEVIPGSEGTYVPEDMPWLFLRMDPIAGQSYAYGYVALLLGDLASLEGLWQALIESAAVSAKTIFVVNPASSTNVKQLTKTPNGGFVTGGPEDIIPLRTDKAADMGVAFQAIERLERGLGFAFLLNQTVQRSGERVTAEEIRTLAQELEDVLAGTYSLLAQELQLRLAKLMIRRLERKKAIEKMDGIAEPTIVTGLEALGRGHDLVKLDTFVQGAINSLGPEVLSKWMNVGDYLKRRATAVGLQEEGLIKSQEEVQQAEAQAQQAAALQAVSPELIKQGGALLQQGEQ